MAGQGLGTGGLALGRCEMEGVGRKGSKDSRERVSTRFHTFIISFGSCKYIRWKMLFFIFYK